MTAYSARRALPKEDWPGVDREMVDDLFRRGDPLMGTGPLAHLRPATRGIYEKDMGFWLGHLLSEGVALDIGDPGDRFTLANLRNFDRAIADLAPATRHSRFTSLIQLMQKARPDRDWSVLRKAVARLQRMARGVSTRRKSKRVASSADLVELGQNLLAQARSSRHVLDRLLLDRDGTMILFLAYHPIRIRNFGTLELGRTLIAREGGFTIVLGRGETKNHRPDERRVHEPVARALQHYLDTTRPALIARSKESTAQLWINRYGRTWPYPKISERIATVTRRELGIDLGAHLFRDSAVTTTMEAAPDQAWTTRGLLHHAGFETVGRHYNHARQLSAAEAWSGLVDDLRMDGTVRGRRAARGKR